MANYCQVCDKGYLRGHRVSHSNRRTGRTWTPNVQKVRVLVKGRPVRLEVCTRCLRSGKVERAV